MDTKLAHPLAYRLHVAGIAEREATHATSDFCLGPRIPQGGEPRGERAGLADFDHLSTIDDKRPGVNHGRHGAVQCLRIFPTNSAVRAARGASKMAVGVPCSMTAPASMKTTLVETSRTKPIS